MIATLTHTHTHTHTNDQILTILDWCKVLKVAKPRIITILIEKGWFQTEYAEKTVGSVRDQVLQLGVQHLFSQI